MPHIFNDLSLNSHIDTSDKFKVKIEEIISYAKTCTLHNDVFYLHQSGIYNSKVCNMDFRTCVNKICVRELKSRLLSLIDKHTPSLPTDSAIPENIHFYYDDKSIPCTGLAECAYQNYMDEIFHSFSLSGVGYDKEKLDVAICDDTSSKIQVVNNIYSLDKLQNICEKNQGNISSWEDMLERSKILNLIRIEDYVLNSLKRESFSLSLAGSVLRRLKILSKIISAENDEVFNELFKNHCTGKKAYFSEESDTKINEYKDQLTFKIGGKDKVCSYHGKIKGDRQFRIHIDERPSRGNERTIVYIGYKITKD